jgi:hypothetical protein
VAQRVMPPVSAGNVCVWRGGMIGGAAVPQSPSGRWSIALRPHRGRDANARRSASACPSAYRETPRACSGFRPVAFGSFVISQAPADGPIPAGLHRQADTGDTIYIDGRLSHHRLSKAGPRPRGPALICREGFRRSIP